MPSLYCPANAIGQRNRSRMPAYGEINEILFGQAFRVVLAPNCDGSPTPSGSPSQLFTIRERETLAFEFDWRVFVQINSQ